MNQKKRYLAVGASLALALALLWVLPSLAASVEPIVVQGNPKCSDYGLIGYKPINIDGWGEDTPDGQYIYTVYGMGTLTVTVQDADANANPSGPFISWSSSFGILKVIVKGGPNANVYTYDPASNGDTNLTTPTNPKNNKPYGLSHVEFCYDDKQAVEADYGDLPTAYGITQLGENGARHIPIQNDVRLGSERDLELYGNPDDNAVGDDNDATDDEDGVRRGPSWGGGQGVISVTVSGASCLMGWVDWAEVDSDNNFVDVGRDYKFSEDFTIGTITYTEKVIDNIYLPASGTYQFTFALPEDFKNATVFARFRLSPYDSSKGNEGGKCKQTAAGLNGPINGGEVEDYYWQFGPTAVELKSLVALPQKSTGVFGLLVVGMVASLAALWVSRRRPQ